MTDPREDEKRSRERLDNSEFEVIKGSGRPLEGKRFDQVTSIRLEPQLVAQLRDIADDRQTTVSQLLREAAKEVVRDAYEKAAPVFSIRTTQIPRSVQIRSYVTHSEGVSVAAASR